MLRIETTPKALLRFTGCWAVFWILGGFSWPENTPLFAAESHDYHLLLGWICSFVMYLFGSICFSLVRHKVGMVEPVSMRIFYILAGLGLMAGGLAWWHIVKSPLGEFQNPAFINY
jgi:hypothetical protein